MSGHTPGPWAYRRDETGEDEFVVVSDGRPYVATVHGGARDWTEHNARLIAAAPELLEACKAQAEELKALREWVAETYGQTKAAPVTGAAVAEQLGRAAIAKATGEGA